MREWAHALSDSKKLSDGANLVTADAEEEKGCLQICEPCCCELPRLETPLSCLRWGQLSLEPCAGALSGAGFPHAWPHWALGPWGQDAVVQGWRMHHAPTLGAFTCPWVQAAAVCGRGLAGRRQCPAHSAAGVGNEVLGVRKLQTLNINTICLPGMRVGAVF